MGLRIWRHSVSVSTVIVWTQYFKKYKVPTTIIVLHKMPNSSIKPNQDITPYYEHCDCLDTLLFFYYVITTIYYVLHEMPKSSICSSVAVSGFNFAPVLFTRSSFLSSFQLPRRPSTLDLPWHKDQKYCQIWWEQNVCKKKIFLLPTASLTLPSLPSPPFLFFPPSLHSLPISFPPLSSPPLPSPPLPSPSPSHLFPPFPFLSTLLPSNCFYL